ncbi:hypothetical protein SKAU_G00065850 [Synaphobranchus kaupii]|uniref:Uncharacterized protein n=1 Tax=Synaphobranchus kaupii TaxID=118154 RepID=A0A9Q1JB84_SYNKA|nr:hypothetical protein SKAU_G00065850 [Synaphobranchus kaupii]
MCRLVPGQVRTACVSSPVIVRTIYTNLQPVKGVPLTGRFPVASGVDRIASEPLLRRRVLGIPSSAFCVWLSVSRARHMTTATRGPPPSISSLVSSGTVHRFHGLFSAARLRGDGLVRSRRGNGFPARSAPLLIPERIKAACAYQ